MKVDFYNLFPRLKDILIGVIVGILNYTLSKHFVPLLYYSSPLDLARKVDSYKSIGEYSSHFTNRIAEVFFVDCFYSPFVESVVFIIFLYASIRLSFNFITSILLSSFIIAIIHQDRVLFFNFFAFGILNCCLYEYRKSLVPSIFHHIAYNTLIYGSQLLVFTKS